MKKKYFLGIFVFLSIALSANQSIPYNIPNFPAIKTGDYLPNLNRAIQLQDARILAIINDKDEASFANTIIAFDTCDIEAENIVLMLSNLCSANGNDSLQDIFNKASAILSLQSDRVYTNLFLFRRVKRLNELQASLNLDPYQTKLLGDIYKRFMRSGVSLDINSKKRLSEINASIALLQNKFVQNLLASTAAFKLNVVGRENLAGLPDNLANAAQQRAGEENHFQFGLDNASVMPALTYLDNPQYRKQLLDGYLSRCDEKSPNSNVGVVDSLLALRLEKAKLLGAPDFASYQLEDRMAKTPKAVYDLLDQIWPSALKKANQEMQEMEAYKKQQGVKGKFEASDWRYYAAKVKAQKYNFDENALKDYFPIDQVKKGIFYVCKRLYGISFEALDSVPCPTPNTQAYLCRDKDGSVLGVVFLDMYARPGAKSGGAWTTSYIVQRYQNGKRLTPVSSIVCNFPNPVGDKPSLLSIDETTTFFHEFGHALNALFLDVPYAGLADSPRDFVELPSQIMEHWALEPEVLAQYAKNYKTGAPIPQELIQKMQDSKRYGQGFKTTEFLAAAYLDMDYHSLTKIPSKLNSDNFEKKVLNKQRHLMTQIPPRYKTCYFAHSMGGDYTVGYYGYTWAEVLDADAFQAFKETGDIFNQACAQSFRKNILERGGSIEAGQMYLNFRGKPADVKALLENRGL